MQQRAASRLGGLTPTTQEHLPFQDRARAPRPSSTPSLWRSCCSKDGFPIGHHSSSSLQAVEGEDDLIAMTNEAKDRTPAADSDYRALEGFAAFIAEHMAHVLPDLAREYNFEMRQQASMNLSREYPYGRALVLPSAEDAHPRGDHGIWNSPEEMPGFTANRASLPLVGGSGAAGPSPETLMSDSPHVGGNAGTGEQSDEFVIGLGLGRTDSRMHQPFTELPPWVKVALRSRTREWRESAMGKGVWARFLAWVTDSVPGTSRRSSHEYLQTSIRRGLRTTSLTRSSNNGETIFATAALLNAIFVCFELQYYVSEDSLPFFVRIVSAGFTLFFSFEWVFRLAGTRWRLGQFFSIGWNAVDTFVLLCLWSEQAIRMMISSPPTWLLWDISLIRVLRFTKLLWKLTMTIESFREIRLLLQAMYVAARSWLWILAFSSVLTFFMSALVAHGTYSLCQDEVPPDRDEMCQYFGTFSKTFGTLFQAVFGGILWGEVLELLCHAAWIYQAIFAAYVSFGIIVIANLATGILIEAHAAGRRYDLECVMSEEQQRSSVFVRTMKTIFREMDTNKSGALSKKKLELALEDPWMHALLRCYDLEIHDAELLFNLLDADRSGFIDMEEFIIGCLKMKGSAKSMDIMRLQVQVEALAQQVQTSASPTDSMRGMKTAGLREMARDRRRYAQHSTMSDWSLATGSERHSKASFSMMPTWVGSRIPRVEERAMQVHDLQVLRNQIRLFISGWVNHQTNAVLSLEAATMYDVNYNWISPLTLPEGATLRGLSLPPGLEVVMGSPITQEPSTNSEQASPGAVGEIVSIGSDGSLTVRVLKGQFITSMGSDASGGLPPQVTVAGQTLCGCPSHVVTPNAMSYKELVSAVPSKPDWYCCHWWGEPIMDFFICIEDHCKLRGLPPTASYWICAFANCQHDLNGELSDDPVNSSFNRAMLMSDGVLLILDSHATPFQRIWCDYELYKTVLDHKRQLDIATVPSGRPDSERRSQRAQILAELPGESAAKKAIRELRFPISVLAKGIQAKLEEGSATVAEDKQRILDHMRKGAVRQSFQQQPLQSVQNLDEVEVANQTLNAYFAWAAWPQALKKGIVRNFFPGNADSSNRIDLTKVTSRERGRQQLKMSLAYYTEVTDSAVADLCKGFPPNLVDLSLSFEGCSQISDRGLQHLSRAVQKCPEIEFLQLDFLGCQQISDLGLESLAKSLPQKLRKLRLDFAKCTHVSQPGLRSLAQSLPAGLQECSFSLKGTGIDRNFETLEELQTYKRAAGLSGTVTGRPSTPF